MKTLSSLKHAKRHAEQIRADMGGTQMIGPFEYIYDQLQKIDGYPRQVRQTHLAYQIQSQSNLKSKTDKKGQKKLMKAMNLIIGCNFI